MGLPLNEFTDYIDETILKRGQDYYRKGHVVGLRQFEQGQWIAQVEGSDLYDVEIEVSSSGVVVDYYCTCPYEWGPVCKHVAAVLYAMREEKPASKGGKKTKSQASQLRDVLEQQTQDTLIEIILDAAKRDRQFQNELMIKYSAAGDDRETYVRAIKQLIKDAGGRHDYIEYIDARNLGRKVVNLLEDAKQGSPKRMIAAAQAVIEVLLEAVYQADDSDGSIGSAIATAFEVLESVQSDLDEEQKAGLFNYLLEIADSEFLRGWDWRWDAIDNAAQMVKDDSGRKILFKMLDGIIGDGGSQADFEAETALMTKLDVITRLDGEDAGKSFIKSHTHIHRFRVMYIEQCIEQGNLTEARKLCEDWLWENDKKGPPGYVKTYQELLLKIDQKEGNTDSIRKMSRKLFIETGRFDYYESLKKHTLPDEWANEVDTMVAAFFETRWQYSTALEILSREERWAELLKYAQKQKSFVHFNDQHLRQLDKHFPGEMCELYEEAAFRMLEQTGSRGEYKNAANYLVRIKKLGFEGRAEEACALLIETYPQRRAMKDELEKALR